MSRALRRWLRIAAARFPRLLALLFVLDDVRWGLRLRFGRLETSSGASHAQLSLDESVRYVETVFRDYMEIAQLQRCAGRAAEVGPGDSAAVALLLRRAGFAQVDMIDRYESARDVKRQEQIYDALDQRHSLASMKTSTHWNMRSLRGVSYYTGAPAEEYFAAARRNGIEYDFIVSRSVLEHMYDPLAALSSMVSVLSPGGTMVHKIDLRDHGMFTPTSPELTFLIFSDALYTRMTRNSGRPNRVLLPEYRYALESLASDGAIRFEILVTQLVTAGELPRPLCEPDLPPNLLAAAKAEVDRYKPRFAARFRSMQSCQLAVSGFFLRVTRGVR